MVTNHNITSITIVIPRYKPLIIISTPFKQLYNSKLRRQDTGKQLYCNFLNHSKTKSFLKMSLNKCIMSRKTHPCVDSMDHSCL